MGKKSRRPGRRTKGIGRLISFDGWTSGAPDDAEGMSFWGLLPRWMRTFAAHVHTANGPRECARRRAQIGAGILRKENGLWRSTA
jgi:hypothetical protein